MVASVACDRCGRPNRAAARFCTSCGAALTAGEDGIDQAAFVAPPHLAGPRPGRAEPVTASAPAPATTAVTAGLDAYAAPQAAVPGPVHRETFYQAQRRHRRRARLLSVVCVLPVAVLAVLVAALISPWLYLAVAGALRLLRLAGPLHGPARGLAEAVQGLLVPLKDAINHRPVYAEDVAWSIAGLVAPSIVVLSLVWMWVRLRFRRAGTGGVLLQLGAREPNPTDLHELRLVNVAGEMAIAAGLPQPRVLLIDGEGVNAAVVGSSHTAFTIVVSRRLLDTLGRDELAGVLADLIAVAGNGDLGIALTILSVFQTIGLVLAGRDILLSGVARRTVWHFLAFSVRPGGTPDQRATRAAEASDLMLRSASPEGLDQSSNAPGPDGRPAKDSGFGPLGCILVWPYLASAMFRMFMLIYMNAVTGPLLGWVWRTRRYLADATAVQLTRDPDWLGHALVELGHADTYVPGGASAAHLFVVPPRLSNGLPPQLAALMGTEIETARLRTRGQSPAQRLQTLRELQVQFAGRMAAEAAAHPELVARRAAVLTEHKQSLADELGMHGLHPPIDKRLKRLAALGGHVAAPARGARARATGGRLLAYGLIGGLVALGGGLLTIAFGMITALAGFFNFLLALPVLLLADWLVRGALH